MAAGWPTKVTYANGDVFNASDINDTNGTLNYINPTSATDNQVLTRDNAASGKVKWANSPANTLTTTGDLYYASAANTPARLGIGTTGQLLAVSGGVPAWTSVSSGCTLIQNATGTNSSVTFSSIPSTYTHLFIVGQWQQTTASSTVTISAVNGTGVTYNSCYSYGNGTTITTATTTTGVFGHMYASARYGFEIIIPQYTSTNGKGFAAKMGGSTGSGSQWSIAGGTIFNTVAISTLTLNNGGSNAYNISLFGLS